MDSQAKCFYEFDNFRLNATDKTLWRAQVRQKIPPKALDLLLILIEHRGSLITRAKLFELGWPPPRERERNESNLDLQLRKIREVLGDSPKRQKFIQNIPKLGYQFVAEVREVETEGDATSEQSKLQSFIDALHDEYVAVGYEESAEENKGSAEEESLALFDPKRIFIPLECTTEASSTCDALKWIKEGFEEGAGQLLLANYGMGKSFLTVKLMLELLEEFKQDPENNPMPLRYPLKWHLSNYDKNEEDKGILKNLHDECLKHHFPIANYEDFKQRVRAGKFVFILDGFDEIPALLNLSTFDPVKGPLKILECLDLRKFGPCPWLVTSRPGAFARVFDDPEEKQRLMKKYRVADLLSWREDREWRTYVQECHDLSGSALFTPISADPPNSTSKDLRDKFVGLVAKHPNLSTLTNTPLFARMLVTIWREISPELDEIGLYRKYSDRVLKTRNAEFPIEMQRQCLESLALYLFITNKASCTEPDLTNAADIDNDYSDTVAIRTFVEMLKTYSLLKYDRVDKRLRFSHESFNEYFLACTLLRKATGGWQNMEALMEHRIPANGFSFLGRMLAKPDNASKRATLAQLLRPEENEKLLYESSYDFRFNLIGIALACGLPFTGAWLSRMSVTECNFRGCDLTRAQMDAVIASGVDFGESDLSYAVLNNARLRNSVLTGANLSSADLSYASLTNAKLNGSILTDANLRWADLCNASVTNARLNGSNLTGANLRWANLSNASLTNIHLHKPVNADDQPKLYGVKGLESVSLGTADQAYLREALEREKHRAPSELGKEYDPAVIEKALADLARASIV